MPKYRSQPPLPGDWWDTMTEAQQQAHVKLRDGYACAWCGTTTDLEVHHWHYPARWCSDLLTLCHTCHEHLHGRREPRMTQRQVAVLRELARVRAEREGCR
jgi:hypothetical protein